MSNQLQVIEQTLNSKGTMRALMLALGAPNSQDVKFVNEARRYASSVIAEIEKTAGDPKKDLTVCHPQSIAQSMIDAARFKMMIDGRQHAHIVKFGNAATLQIGYRGYLAKIKEHYPDADFTVEPIWQGDVLNISDENGFQSYTLKKSSAFNDDLTKLQGILAVISYTMGERKIQKVTTMSAKEIEKVKGAAKTKFVWDSWYIEKAKAAAIKRAAKIHFAAIQGMQEIIQYDNSHNFSVDRPDIEAKSGGIIENLNKSLAGADASEIKDVEFVEDANDKPNSENTSAMCLNCGGKGSVEFTDSKTGETGIEPCNVCQ